MRKYILTPILLFTSLPSIASTVELQLGYLITNVSVTSDENPIIVVEYNDSKFTDINTTFCVDEMTTSYTSINMNTEKYYSFQYNGAISNGCANGESQYINGKYKDGEYAYIEFINDEALVSTQSNNSYLQAYMHIDDIEINKEDVEGTPLYVTEDKQTITIPLLPVESNDNKLYIYTSLR